MKSKEFADKLLQDYGVAALSGTAFGEYGEGYLRLSYANSEENLQRALDRMTQMRAEPLPTGYSADQWKEYLNSNEQSADQILGYVKAIKARSEGIRKAAAEVPTGKP